MHRSTGRRLAFEGPLDWDAMAGYFALRAIPGVERVERGAYRRTIVVAGSPGVVEIRGGAPGRLDLRARLAPGVRADGVVERVRRIFDLDGDVDAACRHLGDDTWVGASVRTRPGLRQPGTWDPFETGVRAIVGQQISVAGATTVTGRLVARHGTPVPGVEALGLSHTFPAPEALVDADLDGLGLTRARADAIRSFARAVVDGDVRLDRGVALNELVASIVAVRGLGPWTAHYLAIRLGERDAFPAADLGLQRAVGIDRSARALERLAERWRPWRALAAVHLWSAPSGGNGRTAI